MRNSGNQLVGAAVLYAALAIAPSAAVARPDIYADFLEEYPFVVGTRLESCNVCHTNPPRRNPYGDDFNLAGRVFSAIESLDSDGDGASNISEITGLTFPGDPNDGPNSTPMPTATATRTATRVPTPTNTVGPTNTPRPTNTRGPTPTIVPGPCYGDCNDNGAVAVNELILGVNISLELVSVDRCPLADADGNGQVSISELIKAVNRALYGCPP